MEAKQRRARPRLDRRNAIKNVDYDASSTSTSSSSSSSSTLTLDDLSLFTSFRVRGQEGEFDVICRNLGLSGPEDFAIPVDAWRSSKARDLTPRSGLATASLAPNGDAGESLPRDGGGLAARVDSGISLLNGSRSCRLGGLEVRNRATSCRTRFKHDTPPALDKCETDNAGGGPNGDAGGPLPRDGGGLAATVDSIELENGLSTLNGSSGYGLGGLENRDRVTSRRTRFEREMGGSALNNSRPSGDTFYAKARGDCENCDTDNAGVGIRGLRPPVLTPPPVLLRPAVDNSRPSGDTFYVKARGDCENCETDNAGGGIRGLRPPVLTPPPALLRSVVDDMSSTWDLLNSFCPQEGTGGDKDSPVRPLNEKDWSDGDDEKVSKERTSQRKGDSDSRLSTSVEDEESEDKDGVGNILSAKILEPVHNVSPNGSFRRRITSWQKGELLGSGSFGTVYEGFTDDGFFFAIKEVSLLDQGSQGKQSLLQLEQEISLLSQFEHENIVRYYGTDKDDKKLYIFLELMTKGSLASLYHKYNLRDSQVSAYTRQILNGLKYLHDQNVVHRDIKCANILVDVSGAVKLADFGLAKATKMNDPKSSKGTAFWMAPEVVNLKNRSYGLAADIWSLGCTVLEMLTRRPPYSHLEGMQALFRIGRGEPPPVPDSLSREARDLILRCLQVNPNDRPSAAQLLDHPFVRKLSTSSGFASPRSNNIWQ